LDQSRGQLSAAGNQGSGTFAAALRSVRQNCRLRNPVIALEAFFEWMQDVCFIVEVRFIQTGNLIEPIDAEFLELSDQFWTDTVNL
jgi:hypothetical protein